MGAVSRYERNLFLYHRSCHRHRSWSLVDSVDIQARRQESPASFTWGADFRQFSTCCLLCYAVSIFIPRVTRMSLDMFVFHVDVGELIDHHVELPEPPSSLGACHWPSVALPAAMQSYQIVPLSGSWDCICISQSRPAASATCSAPRAITCWGCPRSDH